MTMRRWVGLYLILSLVLLGEFLAVLGGYIFERLNLDRNLVLISLWTLPIGAAFLSALEPVGKVRVAFVYLLVLCILGPAFHFLIGELWSPIDFGGWQGLKVTFPIYLFFGFFALGLGSMLGIFYIKLRRGS